MFPPKGFAALLLIVALLLPSAAVLAEPTEITLLWWLSDARKAEHDANMQIIRRFEELHPHIKVNTRFAEYSAFTDQTVIMSLTGDPPDVVWIREDHFFDLATSGYLLDLTEFIAQDPDIAAVPFLPGVLELGQVRGTQYALYRDIYTPNLFYNRLHFTAAGMADPSPGWTYDELARVAQRLTNPEQLRYGMGNIHDNWPSVVLSYGGSVMNEDETRFTLNTTEVLAGLNYIHALIWEYGAQPTSSEGLAEWAEPQFMAGQVTMVYRGPYRWADFNRQLDFEWDVAPTPVGPAGAYAYIKGLPMGILAQSRHPEEAWQLLKFLGAAEEAQALQVELGIASPVVGYSTVLGKFYESPDAPRSLNNYIQSLTQSARPGMPHLPSVIVALLDQMIDAIRSNTLDVNTAVLETQRQAQAYLDELR